jgi:RHS repeat-associated protein
VEYGLHLMDNGALEVLESGNNRGTYGSYSVGDVLKVAVVSGVVKYYRNNTVIYTSGVTPSYPLYLDTSFYSPGSKLKGALLCAGSACTSGAPYTSYYTFGGKAVGMRRANYPTAASNSQFRIVGDHLGSTTLLVDVAIPPSVVQRQYHKPYGETAWQYEATSMGADSLTNVGYTGQRTDEDSTGLMFYNARVYDPVLSTFVSADPVVIDANDPKALGRYAYVNNSPLAFTDPSGYCKFSYSRDGVVTNIDNFDCTVEQIDQMTAQERIAFVDFLQACAGVGNAFEGVKGVIQYFHDSGIIDFTPSTGGEAGSWASLADAYTLAAMQDGYRRYNNLAAINDFGTSRADVLWQDFYSTYHEKHGNWDDPALGMAWGRAEDAAVHYGIDKADEQRGRPRGMQGYVIQEFVASTDHFRQQLKDYGTHLQYDPRSKDAAYNLAMSLQAWNVVRWTIGSVNQKNYR